jgi:hypothetical protein
VKKHEHPNIGFPIQFENQGEFTGEIPEKFLGESNLDCNSVKPAFKRQVNYVLGIGGIWIRKEITRTMF